MPLYEQTLLLRQDVSQQQVETLVDQYKTIIESNGGKVEKVEFWGLKTLAYKISKNRKAHFAYLNIDASAKAIAEVERLMGINEDVLRNLTIRVEKFEEGASVMMQKRERDPREDGSQRSDVYEAA
jgi:small subunit ribosomal protein S6